MQLVPSLIRERALIKARIRPLEPQSLQLRVLPDNFRPSETCESTYCQQRYWMTADECTAFPTVFRLAMQASRRMCTSVPRTASAPSECLIYVMDIGRELLVPSSCYSTRIQSGACLLIPLCTSDPCFSEIVACLQRVKPRR